MNHLIAENQTAFVKEGNISKGILITTEVVSSMLNKESSGVVLKIDFAKASDSISWEFLEETLKSFDFSAI